VIFPGIRSMRGFARSNAPSARAAPRAR
jgi:hypothetical protein